MPLLTIHHKTEYRCGRPAASGEPRSMLRLPDSRLGIVPEPTGFADGH
jgi:hypothetical protein